MSVNIASRWLIGLLASLALVAGTVTLVNHRTATIQPVPKSSPVLAWCVAFNRPTGTTAPFPKCYKDWPGAELDQSAH